MVIFIGFVKMPTFPQCLVIIACSLQCLAITEQGTVFSASQDRSLRYLISPFVMTMIATVLMRMRMIILKRMMTVDTCRSWDAVKGVALDQTTDHADYVQV